MTRLPTVGGDDGNWGTVLNEYLQTEHATDGVHILGSGLVTENVNTVTTSTDTLTLTAMTTSTMHNVTLTDNCTLTFPTVTAGQSFILVLRQDGTGSRTATWPDNVLWAGGTAPTLTTTPNAVDVLTFICVDGSNWYGFVSGQDMQ